MFFLRPQASATWRSARCTPPRSSARCGRAAPYRPPCAVGKQQPRVAVLLPKAAQHGQGCLRQRHKAVAVALGVANVHADALRIDVGHRQGQAFTEPQAQAVQGEEEHAVAQDAGGGEQRLGLFDA